MPKTRKAGAPEQGARARRRPSARPRIAPEDHELLEAPAVADTSSPMPAPREAVEAVEAVDALESDPADTEPTVDAAAVDDPAANVPAADRRRPRWLRRPTVLRRRTTFYVAAALVGALSVSPVVADNFAAQADSQPVVSESVSVARQLGITADGADELSPAAASERLGELVVCRTERETEQAAYAQAQQRADKAAQERKAAAAAEAARPKAVLPVKGARLTSSFGPRWGTLHAGIDLAAPMRTPEYAAMDGVVLEAGPASGFGLVVYIQHQNGDVTVYGHMDEILVTPGQVVKAGDTIALLGNRGQSTGPHLHFEVHVGGLDGQKIDPIPWLAARGVRV